MHFCLLYVQFPLLSILLHCSLNKAIWGFHHGCFQYHFLFNTFIFLKFIHTAACSSVQFSLLDSFLARIEARLYSRNAMSLHLFFDI